jgi:hypothetical protein
MEVFDTGIWAMRTALLKWFAILEVLHAHEVMTVAVYRESQAAIRCEDHLDLGVGQPLGREINKHGSALCAHGIKVVIHWVLGQSRTPGNEQDGRPVDLTSK